MRQKTYDVAIVGGGISGTALFYLLCRYTNVRSLVLLEKNADVATLNSNARCNSQTLHCGDIESNYTLDKAAKVKATATMVAHYCMAQENSAALMHTYPKMLLGVGEQEVACITHRYEQFKDLFPYLNLWDFDTIKAIEPHVALKNGLPRPEPIAAIGCTDEYCAVDFGKVAHSFLDNAVAEAKKTEILLGCKVTRIEEGDAGFTLTTSRGTLAANCVVVNAGAHSLYYAHQMGYGLEYSLLPVAGSFYFVPQMLHGKVYTVQNDKLPFAAIHGDPDMVVPGKTRLGPTAVVLPMLERYHWDTVGEFFTVLKPDMHVAEVFLKLLQERDIRNYMIKNLLFETPYIRQRLFLKEAQKILPSLTLQHLEFAEGIGGLRPQIIDRKHKKLLLGEASINTGRGMVFNMTPSPGATSCLGNGYKDMLVMAEHLGATVDDDRFHNDLVPEDVGHTLAV